MSVVSFASFLEREDQPVIWRGPMLSNAIMQLLEQVEWGRQNYLIADLPPGTGDAPLTIMQIMKPDGVIVVTMPQTVAAVDAKRAANMVNKLGVNVLGIIENMSGNLFGGCGGKKLANDLGVKFLGKLELKKEIDLSGERGKPFILSNRKSGEEFIYIAEKIKGYWGNMKIVIIGCGAGGIVASHVIKKINPEADVTIIGREKSIFIRCSAPYALAGVSGLEKCIKPESMVTGTGTKLIQDEATSVDVKSRVVKTKSERCSYDYLIFATGAKPFLLPIEGIGLKNVFTLRTADDAKNISKALKGSKDVVIIGGGMIGVETACLLSDRFRVTIVEMLPSLFPLSYDKEYSKRVENLLSKNGIKVLLGKPVAKLTGDKKVNAVHVASRKIKADVVLVAAGIRAETDLAKRSGIKTGKFGIETDKRMQTNIKGVYAVGDCAQTFSMLTGKPVQSGLVTTAVFQAKVAGMNVNGMDATFDGVLNSSVTQIFDRSLGRVGLTEEQARIEKIRHKVGTSETLDKYDTQPGSKPLATKLIFNHGGMVIGAQVIGSGHIVPGIINMISFAIQRKSTLKDLLNLKHAAHPELTPLPFADPVVLACESLK